MAKYRYALFDLDGTLTDSAEGITKSVAYALEKFGIIVKDLSELQVFVGPPLVDTFRAYYSMSDEDAHKAVAFYRERFSDIGIFENRVYDGIKELLEELKKQGLTLIVATSKPELFANRIAEHFDIKKYFDIIVGATFDGKISTKKQVIDEVFARAGITNKAEAVMIGDRRQDTEGAAAAGIDSIGVLYGYGSREELESTGATFIAATPRDIKSILIG